MKIGLDFDGVFCDAGKLLRDSAKILFDLDLPEEKITESFSTEEGILTKKQFSKLKSFAFGNSSQEIGMVPVFGVDSACKTLVQRGHQLKIITKRKEGVFAAENFCKMLGINIPIIGMNPGQPKSSVTNGLDVFLDDSLNNLLDLEKSVPNLFLFSWAYNLHSNFRAGERIVSWKEFVQKIG